ncbi:MAG: alanine glycine permease [Planctomycetaceae bacterium]|nr:alanine glycine permease [Planctomycetaceae bacterium]
MDILQARADAPEELPAAIEALDAYRGLPLNARSEDELEKLERTIADLEKAASAHIYVLPLIVVFLLLGGVFFTIRYGFINLRLFSHGIAVLRGRYDDPKDHGEISHFQALTSALSATVGLGNISGVAIAISGGGPGAVFWMWVVAFFGMSSKFSSCTLAQVYRRISRESREHGAAADDAHALPGKSEHVLGGPMVYLQDGMKDVFGTSRGRVIGGTLAIVFAMFAIFGSLGGGNLFQCNQTFAIVSDLVFHQDVAPGAALAEGAGQNGVGGATEALTEAEAAERKADLKSQFAWVGGLVMAILVGIVIVGGIKRIGEVTAKMVPLMCLFYVGVCLVIVFANFKYVPGLISSIFTSAFSSEAVTWGGMMGILVVGVTRGAFSNEAGLGSAAIAHSAARTQEPVREGVVAMTGPFIDTIVVCTMTALAILITGAHLDRSAGGFTNEGVGITASAFASLAPILTIFLAVAVMVFAYSTMISWSYYGERASEFLFGRHGIWPYRILFLTFVFLAPMVSLDNVINFTDLLILSLAYPNILGMIILSPKVARLARDYVRRLKSGEIRPYESKGVPSTGVHGDGV